jgi:predicted transcriptional regulator
MKRYNFFLPIELVAELQKLAKEKDMSMSALIRKVLTKYVQIQQ